MILSTHAIAGAAVALAFRQNPPAALLAAFLSHFLLDAIPHWHYRIFSLINDGSSRFDKKIIFLFNRGFIKDIFRAGLDFGLGLAVSLTVFNYFFSDHLWLTFFGALAGVLPDALQVAYHRFPNFKPLYYFQLFHVKAHAEKRLDNEPVKGIAREIIASAAFILALIFFV